MRVGNKLQEFVQEDADAKASSCTNASLKNIEYSCSRSEFVILGL